LRYSWFFCVFGVLSGKDYRTFYFYSTLLFFSSRRPFNPMEPIKHAHGYEVEPKLNISGTRC
jgi:hypothetical protein